MESGSLDAAPIWSNLKSFPWSAFSGRVDILSGGYPCQPFSAAGKRLGTDDERHLWPYIANGIRILRPRVCFFENVEGHISLGLREVIDELGGMGYRATWGIFSAAEVGAPHQRKRVFIMAYREGAGLEGHDRLFAGCGQSRWHASEQARPACWSDSGGDVWPSRPGEPQHGWEPPRVVGSGAEPAVGDTAQRQDHGREPRDLGGEEGQGRCGDHAVDSTGEGVGDKRKTQPEVGGDTDGVAGGLGYAELCISSDNRTDELRLLGNGVVPATAARAFAVLMEELLS